MSFTKVSYQKLLDNCNFLPSRKPDTKDFGGAFSEISKYQQGAIFVGHYAGDSEWELHHCEEIVMVLAGEAIMYQLRDGEEVSEVLTEGELTIVPENTWHKFSVATEVKIMTITTKQPSEYSIEKPSQ